MSHSLRTFLGLVTAVVGLGLPISLSAQLASDAYETGDSVRAVDILPEVVLRSGHHRVRDRVLLERDIYSFEVDSDYGVYRIHTLPMLEIRTRELRTLAQAISQYKLNDDAFAERLRGQLTVNAYSLVDVVTAPFSMAEQLANNIGQTAEEFGDFPTGAPDTTSPTYVDDMSIDIIGGAHKRNVAYQLGLDAYSTNPKVQEFLNTVARARSSGHFKAGVATIRIPPSRQVKIAGGRLDAEIRSLLKELSPDKLDGGIDDQLARIGVTAEDRHRFTNHAQYSPRHKTVITAYLDFVRGIENREVLIHAALSARSEAEALSYEVLSKMLAHYHESVEPVLALEFLADLPVAISSSERLLVLMPVDVIRWDRRTEKNFAALSRRLSMAGHLYPELVVSGSLTEKSRKGLDHYGFSYREQFLTIR